MSIPRTPPLSEIQLPDHEQEWLDSQNFNIVANVNRWEAVEFVNSQLRMPFKDGAVFRAFNNGDIPTAFVSGKALASQYDIARWALTRKYASRERDRKRYIA
jgi:hypothetical protein